MSLAPIALFVYNRPEHTKKTIDALQQNYLAKESDLWIFADAAKQPKDEKAVQQVRTLLRPAGFRNVNVVERDTNLGLADSVIQGTSELLNKYGSVISLEDDLITSPHFIQFMNEGLEFYKKNKRVFSISGFSFSRTFMKFDEAEAAEVYSHYRPMSWGWATWKSRWDKVDWEVVDYESFMASKEKRKKFELGGSDLTTMLKYQKEGLVDSWYIRWSYACYKQGLLNIYPRISLINNIGHDGSGVHKSNEAEAVFSHDDLLVEQKWMFVNEPTINSKLVRRFNETFNPTYITRLKRKLLSLLGDK